MTEFSENTTSQSRTPTIPPGVVPSLSREDLYNLLWKEAEDKDTNEHFNDVKLKDSEQSCHHGNPSRSSQSENNPFEIEINEPPLRDVRGQPPRAWHTDQDITQERERSMTPTRRIEVQPSRHAVYTETDQEKHTRVDDSESEDGKKYVEMDRPSNSPLGMLKARKMRKVQPQLLGGDSGEALYAQVDKKGKKKGRQYSGKDKMCDVDVVVMETDQPKLLRVREITSPERDQGAGTTSHQGCDLPSVAAMPQPSVPKHQGKSGDYADPEWVYEEIGGNSKDKLSNPITSTPKASKLLADDVTDDDCFTEEQFMSAQSDWPVGPGSFHVEHQNTPLMTPLHYAAAMGKCRYLLELLRGITNNTQPVLRLLSSDRKQQAVHDVSSISYSTMNSIDCVDGHGRTALMHAVHWCQVDCARLLLHEGANINIQAPDGSTALHQAVYSSTPNVVDMLLHHQADPHHKDNQGQSPLHWATNNQSIKVLSYLMDKVVDVDVNVCDEANMTPLMWAAYNAQSKHMQLLLDKGADTHLVDIDGMAAVHWSIHKNDTSCLKLLLTHESSKFRCHKGKTVIHYAAEQGSADCACITMAVRPNCVDDTDNEGRTALHWAAACQKPEVIRAVLAAQGNPNIKDHHGFTAYDYAVSKHFHYCALLLSGQTLESVIGLPHSQTVTQQRPRIETVHESESPNNVVNEANTTDRQGRRLNVMPNANKLIKGLTLGCWMGKFTNRGRGPLHNRLFWMNLSNGKLCWSLNSDPSKKDVKSELLVDIRPTPSDIIAGRKDYDPVSKHQFAFSLLTPNRVLHVVACCEEDYRLWVDGLQCFLALGIESAVQLFKSSK